MNRFDRLKFAKDMQEWLKQKDFNLKEAAIYSNVPASTIQKIASGQHTMSDSLVVIAYWMDFDLRDYVIDDEGWGRQLKMKGL